MTDEAGIGRTYLVFEQVLGHRGDFSSYAWQPFRPGVEIARLQSQGASALQVALLRYAPGARVPSHVHHGLEYILVLSGSQRDEQGIYPTGSLVVHGAGTRHRVMSDDGCVVLAIWERPVEMVEGEA